MKTLRFLAATASIAVVLAAGSSSYAATYDLTAAFSSTANPNGVWSFVYDGSPLAHQGAPVNNNPFVPAIPAGGYFSTGNNLNTNTPDVFQAAVDGTGVGQTNLDFLAGDVLIHSPNDGSQSLFVVWTAPSAGLFQVSGSVWYAHSSAGARSNLVTLLFNGVPQGSETISSTAFYDRDHRAIFGGAIVPVNAGDTFAVAFAKTAGQTFGSINGITEIIEFTPNAVANTPIPGALPLFASGLAGIAAITYRRRRKQKA